MLTFLWKYVLIKRMFQWERMSELFWCTCIVVLLTYEETKECNLQRLETSGRVQGLMAGAQNDTIGYSMAVQEGRAIFPRQEGTSAVAAFSHFTPFSFCTSLLTETVVGKPKLESHKADCKASLCSSPMSNGAMAGSLARNKFPQVHHRAWCSLFPQSHPLPYLVQCVLLGCSSVFPGGNVSSLKQKGNNPK